MNTLKLQNDLIKAAFNRDEKGKPFYGFYLKRESEIVIGPDHSQAFVIPNERLYIDVEKVFNGKEVPTFENVLSNIENDKDYALLKNANALERHVHNGKKLMFIVLKTLN